MSFEFNKEFLNNYYKLIWADLMSDGLTMPYLIKENTDREFYPTLEDRESLGRRLTEKQHQKLSEAYFNRRLKEKELWDSTRSMVKRMELFQEYRENEVFEFLKRYPKYDEVIVK